MGSVGFDIGKAVGNSIGGAVKGIQSGVKAVKDSVEHVVDHVDDFGEGVSDSLGKLGLTPDSGPGKEIISGLSNLAVGNLLGVAKDAADILAMSSGKTNKHYHHKQIPTAKRHTPKRAQIYFQDCMFRPKPAQKHYHIHIHQHHNNTLLGNMLKGMSQIALPALGKCLMPYPICRPITALPLILMPPPFTLGLIGGAIAGQMVSDIGKIVNDLIGQGIRDGSIKEPKNPVLQESNPLESSASDILADKSLSFEDKIFMLMSKIMSEQEKKIEAMADKMASKLDAAEKKKEGSKADGTKEGSKSDGPSAGDVGGMMKDIVEGCSGKGGPGSLFGAAKGIFSMIKPFLPMIAKLVAPMLVGIAPPVGMLIAAVLPQAIGPLSDVVEQGLSAGANATNGSGGQQTKGSSNGSIAGSSSGSSQQGGSEVNKTKEGVNSMKNDMEKVKRMMQKMTEMQQIFSNMMNMMHKSSMNTISNIR